jgi:hypothetical protein
VRALELWLLSALVALMFVQVGAVFITLTALDAKVSRFCNIDQYKLGKIHSNMKKKGLIYTSCLKPIWQYAFSIWNSTIHTHIHKIQILQNIILRMGLCAPWYVRNTTIHKDIQLPFVTETLHYSYSRHHSTLTGHPTISIHLFVIFLKDTLDASRENAALTSSHCNKHSREAVIGQHLPH